MSHFQFYFSDLTEVGFFLGDLRAQLAQAKPNDKFAYTQKYFETIRTGAHIVGMPYPYIVESNHNKRSFLMVLIEAFKGFPESMEVTSFEFLNMLESLCPNFPKSVVLDASQSLQRNIDEDGSSTKHSFKAISQAVFGCILYDDWLKLISDFYAEETSTNSMNMLKLKSKIEEFYISISPSVCQPMLEISYSVLDASHPSSSGAGTSSYLVEVTLDQFRKTFLLSDSVRGELLKLASTVGETK